MSIMSGSVEITQDDLGAWSVGGRTFERLRDAKAWVHSRPPELGLRPSGAYGLTYRACTERGWREAQEVSGLSGAKRDDQ